MSKALSEVKPGIWRWDGVDVDHGFPIVGYMTNVTGTMVMIDPPGTSGSEEEIRGVGTPRAILLTNMWHVRGAVKWANLFDIPIYAPASAVSELAEYGGALDVAVSDGDDAYGWQVLHDGIDHDGKRAFDEVAYWHASSQTLVLGDLVVTDDDGKLADGPVLFSNVPAEKVQPIKARWAALGAETILSAHLGMREDVATVLA